MIRDQVRFPASSFAVMAAALILGLAVSCPAAAFSFGKKKQVEAPPPPPPVEATLPVGPPVLADYVVRQASAYATYMRHASAISSTFPDGPSVGAALRIGARSEQHQLQQGVVAYAAIVALQDSTFVNAVRAFAAHASQRDAMVRYILADPNYVTTLGGHESAAGLIVAAVRTFATHASSRDQMIGYILADPSYVLSLGGHDSAAGLIVATLNDQASRLAAAGDKVKQMSLDIQLKAAWSKKPVPNPDQRLLDVKQLSSAPAPADDDLRAQLLQAESAPSTVVVSGPPVNPPYSQAVIRGMALAALAVLGRAGDANMDYVMPLLVNDTDGYCFNMAKLNLYQCLSVARPYYEDMYCLGLHIMDDTGHCVAGQIGHPEPAAPAPLIAAAMPVSTGPLAAGAPISTSAQRR